MFRSVAAFELRYQLKSPAFWVTFAIFLLLTFGAVASDNVQIGSGGNVWKNSPFAIAQTLMVMTVFSVFILTAFVANVVVRDDETGFGPIIHSTRLSRFDYLFGRFTGAFLAGCLLFLSAPLGMIIGAAMPWLDPEVLGPFNPGHYAFVYLLLCVPTLFVTGAGFFAIATATRSMMWTYVGVIAFLVLYLVAMGFLSRPEFINTVALIDPFGLGAYDQATRYWTATERNTQIPGFTGYILWNRALWVGVAFALLGLAWAIYSRAARGSRIAAGKAPDKVDDEQSPAKPGTAAAPAAQAEPDRDAGWSPLWALAKFDIAAAIRSPAFIVLLGIGFVNALGSLWYADEFYGNTIHPVTRVMIEALQGAFTIIPLIIAIYYAGELVWRDRDRRMHEIVDSTPAPDWAFVVPKILAISIVLFSTLAVSVLAAVAVQALKGYFDFETSKYLAWYMLPTTVTAVLFAVLAILMQTVVPHKTLGWMLMLLFVVAQVTLDRLGFEHNLYQYAGTPVTPLSDMNGQGDFGRIAWWFQAYWSAAAVLLAVLAYALWRRGTGAPLRTRLAHLPRRLRGTPGIVAAAAVVAMGFLGGWIYYNTNVLNDYTTKLSREREQADYEKALIGYEAVPQPRITDVVLAVDLYPDEPRAVTRGSYVIQNRTGKPLDQVHVRWMKPLRMTKLDVEGARLETEHVDQDYRIYRFDRPMAPLETCTIRFETLREQRGFRNSDNEHRIVDNGTFLDNTEIAPSLGMDRNGLLQDRARRRKYGLPPELRPARLEDESARGFNGLRRDSDWVNSDITVSTAADQIAIAPGYRASDTVTGGRRTTRYRSNAPINNFFSLQSARYEVAKDRWRDVELAVYHDRAHGYNVQRMQAAMKASLDYFTAHLSPFQFRQLRILEFPDYAKFAQSFANTIPFSEGIGFIADYRDPEKIDMVTYVTAHEVGHQWWGHQVISSDQQGGAFIVESLAQYSALMVMEQMYGPEEIRKFLKFELDKYLRSRGSEVLEELPLVRVEYQPYIYYQKGGIALYLLKDQLGAGKVNEALRGLIAQFAFKPAPYANPTDLIRRFRAVAGPGQQQLITDLFEKITLYDVKVTDAKAQRRTDGRWDVTLEVDARKLYADGKGTETEAPLDELFDVGAFTIEPGRKGYDKSSVLAVERRRVHSGRQTLTIVTEKEPNFAGVDPFNKWIDRNADDNVKEATKAQSLASLSRP
ncbi:MAG: M1 family aminopeptidase [Gammaproteobacteria bacterium]|nr:M1 family aminopeptidase [Gammaproteobacteria bacterium]